ncbi:MAG TPA: LuxR C-terminal-related transcriptional regulator [Jiangellales bacterium]|nr:LuxR C-terminal-related transcriptional regulator [Jiangellales bacterium]
MDTAEPNRHAHAVRSRPGEELIVAKLRVPEPLAPLFARPRIGARLRTAVQRSAVVLFVGPSGIGKTAELMQWSSGIDRPVAWLTVDGRDNDPQRLWRHVVAALSAATGDPALQPPAVLAPGSDVYLSALADGVRELERPPVLVLDEYEHVVNPEIHEQLDALIRACGDRLTTVIASRVRPPLRLERLLLSGRLSTFTWSDLRVDAQETQRLLAEVFGVTVDPEAAAALAAAVDGWAGGLMLAGTRLRAGEDAAVLANRLGDGRESATDYLLDHVWAGLAAPMRAFLLDTAVLGRFSAALADAVRGRTDSAELLDRLRWDGLFVVAEDSWGTWVRYQRLFRQALLHRLEATNPERVQAVHRSAAQWHLVHGSREKAVDHALFGRDYKLAVGMLQDLFDDYYQRGRLVTLEQWLSALPDEEIAHNPWLVNRALGLWCYLGRFDERDRWARAVDYKDRRPTRPEDVWRLCLPRERGDLALALRQGRALLRSEASVPDHSLVSSQVRISVARSLLLAGQLAECRRLLDEITARETRPLLRVTAHGIAGLAAYLARDRAAAVGHAEQVHYALDECQLRPNPRTAAEGIILRAVMADEEGDDEGVTLLKELIDTPPGFGTDKTMHAFALIFLARMLAKRAESEESACRLADADELLAAFPSPLGMTDLRNEVASAIRKPGYREPRTATVALSEREVVVLQYLRSELTLREIAEDLFLSVNTVKTHARNVYRKLGVNSRQELAKPLPGAVQAAGRTRKPEPTASIF